MKCNSCLDTLTDGEIYTYGSENKPICCSCADQFRELCNHCKKKKNGFECEEWFWLQGFCWKCYKEENNIRFGETAEEFKRRFIE